MVRILSLGLLLLFSATSSMGQTYYGQSHACSIATYNCNGIPLKGGGAYSFGGGFADIVPKGYFSLAVNGAVENGKITRVIKQAPVLRKGNSGPFAFSFETTGGDTGTVSGMVAVHQVCGKYCWPVAIIESSTVVVKE